MAEIEYLKEDYLDDILAKSNDARKYTLIDNPDGTKSFEDKTEYEQEGDPFGAGGINKTNKFANDIYRNRILTLDEAKLVTEPGFFVDAKVVKEILDRKTIFNSYPEEDPTIQLNYDEMVEGILYNFMVVVQTKLDVSSYRQEITAKLNGGIIGINGDNSSLMSTFLGQCQKGDTLSVSSYKTGGRFTTYFTRIILMPE